ncbi:kinase-like domain-containing protein [Pisolithus croceorrhizus]|nr:kinase-like domain-containing protein [Pisolithus croceorrhizus]
MERNCDLPLTSTYQQHAEELSSVLHELSERASRYCINLNGSITRHSGRTPLRGGTAFVYQGTWTTNGTMVAIKTFHRTMTGGEDELKHRFQEVYAWSKLRHENIVPMFGISTEFDSTISIISEWMPLGNAHDYVQNPEHDPRPLLKDIASGLQYLHSHELGIVHGDLKGANVLVSNDRRALLTDFGFSTLDVSTFSMTVDAKRGISFHWTAPELLDDSHASMASDVWAFGMTVLELFTRALPFSNCNNSRHVLGRLMQKKLPPRPAEESTQLRMTDAWWDICTSCWRYDPSSRPIMKDIIKKSQARQGEFGVEEERTEDIIIAVVGPTGSGKSSFIDKVATGGTGQGVGHHLTPYTNEVKATRCTFEESGVVLVDTPGFDDTKSSDLGVLTMVSHWLNEEYHKGTTLSAILWFHRIMDSRMVWLPLKNLRIFEKLCGKVALPKVVLVTTMWDEVDDAGEERLRELKDSYWQTMMLKGSKTFEYKDTQESATQLIRSVVHRQQEITLNGVQLEEETSDLELGMTKPQRFWRKIRQSLKFLINRQATEA